MSVVGYVRERGKERTLAVAQLQARGCTSVHFESDLGVENAVLQAVVRFLRAEDRLVVNSLRELGATPTEALRVLESASAKRAIVEVLGCGLSGDALRVALDKLQELPARDPVPLARASADEVQQLRAAGCSVKEIAARLGVSRVTVWRRLRSAV